MIKVENLNVGYEKKIILENVSVDIERGKVVTLIGPNGSGKSTLLKTIASQLDAIGGNIYIDDIMLSEYGVKDISKRLSLLMTEKINPELLTCFDVVSTGRYPYTGKLGLLAQQDIDMVRWAMDKVHVEELSDLYFDKISDGQRQRVMLARAICQTTDYMILDEPTTYLDINYKIEFLDIVRDLKENNIGMIMSLHELELAFAISDTIVCINSEGKVDKVAKPEEVFANDYIDYLFGMKAGSYSAYLGK